MRKNGPNHFHNNKQFLVPYLTYPAKTCFYSIETQPLHHNELHGPVSVRNRFARSHGSVVFHGSSRQDTPNTRGASLQTRSCLYTSTSHTIRSRTLSFLQLVHHHDDGEFYSPASEPGLAVPTLVPLVPTATLKAHPTQYTASLEPAPLTSVGDPPGLSQLSPVRPL